MSTETITISTANVIVSDPSFVLKGTRTSGITSVSVNGKTATLDTNVWYILVSLVPGSNLFVVEGSTVAGIVKRIDTTITFAQYVPVPKQPWNYFDEYGLLLGLKRLPGERNRSYALRLMDEVSLRSGSGIQRFEVGTARALGIPWYPAALTLRQNMDTTGKPVGTNLGFWVSSSHLVFTCDELVASQVEKIESGDGYVTLDNKVTSVDKLNVFELTGTEIPNTDYSYDQDLDRLVFLAEHRGKYVRITYNYLARFRLDSYTTTTLAAALAALLDGRNNSFLSITVDTDAQNIGAKYLLKYPFSNIVVDTPVNVPAALASFKELADKDFQKLWYDSTGHAYNTQLEAWAKRIAILTRSGWTSALLDIDLWEETPLTDGLPNLFDPEHTYWTQPQQTTKYSSSRTRYLGGVETNGVVLSRVGIPNKAWTAGVGSETDLVPIDLTPVQEGA